MLEGASEVVVKGVVVVDVTVSVALLLFRFGCGYVVIPFVVSSGSPPSVVVAVVPVLKVVNVPSVGDSPSLQWIKTNTRAVAVSKRMNRKKAKERRLHQMLEFDLSKTGVFFNSSTG